MTDLMFENIQLNRGFERCKYCGAWTKNDPPTCDVCYTEMPDAPVCALSPDE